MADIVTDIEEMKRLICEFLVGASLADHLGDIRDDEDHLWKALGIDPKVFQETMYSMNRDYDSTYRPTRKTLIDHGYFDYLPDWVQREDDEDDE